jgi:hypothetical protein
MHAPLNLSPRKKQMLDALRRFIKTRGRSPSVREVAKMVGLNSTTAFDHLRWLRSHGLVVGGGGARCWRPSDVGPTSCPGCAAAREEAVRACIEIARLHGAESACREMGLMLEAANVRTTDGADSVTRTTDGGGDGRARDPRPGGADLRERVLDGADGGRPSKS